MEHKRKLANGSIVIFRGDFCLICGAAVLGTAPFKYHGHGKCIPKFNLVRELKELNK